MHRLMTVICLTAAAGCSASLGPAPTDDLLIHNVIIISPERQEPSTATDILIRDGRIVAIAPDIPNDGSASLKVIDGGGRYLTPGLIDAHTHLSEIPGMTYQHEQANQKIARDAKQQIPRSYLYHGFTTVIDLNATPDYIARWNRRDIRPQAHFCGAAPVFDGYPMSFMPKPARYKIMPYFLYDESRADEFPEHADPTEHSPEAVVTKMRADGAICVKTHFERGFGGRGDLPVPTVDIIRELISFAHEAGIPVLLHANKQTAQQFGIDAGVDAFAHGMWTWNDRSTTTLNPEVINVLNIINERDIATQPTIQVLYGERDLHNPDYLRNPALRDVLPQSLIDWYATEDGQWWRKRMAENPYITELLEEGRWKDLDANAIARVTATLSFLAENNGALIFGSDTPSDPTFANPPGLNGRLEMNNWVAAGVSPQKLFRTATIENAQFFGLENEIGTIEIGKRADLLLLAESPLENVAAYDTINLVIVAGNAVAREDLSARSAERDGE